MVHWNSEGYKIGLCTVPPLKQKYSLLCLANNCCIKDRFAMMVSRFNRLYSKKAMIHHYTRVDGMEADMFREVCGHGT